MKNFLAAIGVLAMLAGTALAVVMLWEKYNSCKEELEAEDEDAELEEVETSEPVIEE